VLTADSPRGGGGLRPFGRKRSLACVIASASNEDLEMKGVSLELVDSSHLLSSAEYWLHVSSRRFVNGEGPRPCRARRKGSALPVHPRLRRGYPTERACLCVARRQGGPPPLLGLSPGLCGPGQTVAYLMHRTVWPKSRKDLSFMPGRPGRLVSST